MRSCLIGMFLLLGFFRMHAQQESLTYDSADSITYRLYMEKNYSELQRVAKEALAQEIDFFYLRMRVGISYYGAYNYEAALEHFKRAYEMSPTDEAVQEYYYYSLFLTGRKEDALEVEATGGERLKTLTGYAARPASALVRSFETLSCTGGFFLTDHSIAAASKDYKADGVYAETSVQGAMSFFSAHIANSLTSRWKLKNYFSIFSVASTGIVQSFLPTVERVYANASVQYNLVTEYRFENGFMTSVAAGVYKERSNRLTATFDPSNITPEYTTVDFDNNAVSASILGGYRYKNLQFTLSASSATFSKKQQLQGEIGVWYYPFGNQNYYAYSALALLRNDTLTRAITSIKLGAKLLPMVWCEVKAGYGNHQNYLGALGVEAYNTVDPIKAQVGIGLLVSWKKMTLQPYYTLQQREMSSVQYPTLKEMAIIRTIYYNQLFTTTLTWNI